MKYDVILLNKKIGDVTLTKETNTHGDRYKMRSRSQAKMMFIKKTSSIDYDVLFEGGTLVESFYSSRNEDYSTVTKVRKEDEEYKVISNDKTFSVKENIDFSSIMLYFKEPVGISRIFVERIGNFVPLKKLAEGEYIYVQPDDTTSIFRYREGKLAEVQLKRKMGSVFVRPV